MQCNLVFIVFILGFYYSYVQSLAPHSRITSALEPSRNESLASGSGSLLETRTGLSASISLGCFADSNFRDLPLNVYEDAAMTIEKCSANCAKYPYFGLQYASQCFCGKSYGGLGTSTNCNMGCSGNSQQTCGGGWANNVYSHGDFTSIGCFADSSTRDLPNNYFGDYSSSGMTVDKCAANCWGFPYFGVQNGGECRCGTQYGSLGTSSGCTYACTGNNQQTCGGPWANNVYVNNMYVFPSFLGCFTDSATRDLPSKYFSDTSMTVEKCAANCAGYTYFGTQYGSECRCGNQYPQQGTSSNCNMNCAGNSGQSCGGSWANSVYLLAPGVPLMKTDFIGGYHNYALVQGAKGFDDYSPVFGGYVTYLGVRWDGDKIRGISWQFANGHVEKRGGFDDSGYTLTEFNFGNEPLSRFTVKDSGYGGNSLRRIEFQTQSGQTFGAGPGGFDHSLDLISSCCSYLRGFYGLVNPDNFMQALGIYFSTNAPKAIPLPAADLARIQTASINRPTKSLFLGANRNAWAVDDLRSFDDFGPWFSPIVSFNVRWDGDKVRGIRYAFANGYARKLGGYDDGGYSLTTSSFNAGEQITGFHLKDSGYGYNSVRKISFETTRQTFAAGPDGYDFYLELPAQGTLAGFYGAVNPDNFMQSLGVYSWTAGQQTTITPAQLQAYAVAYAPQIKFDSGEAYMPSSVDFYLPYVQVVDGAGNVQQQPATLTSSNLPNFNGNQNLFLKTKVNLPCDSCTLDPWMEGMTNLNQVPIYCTIVQKGRNRYNLVYYTFFPYNAGKTQAGSNFGNHVGDWEHITVQLDFSLPSNPIVAYLGSQHDHAGYYCPSGYSQCTGNLIGTNDGHPIFYSAKGSHGYYNAPGSSIYKSINLGVTTLNLYDDHDGNGAVWNTWNNVLTRFDLDPTTGNWAWWSYQSRWGNPAGASVPIINQAILEPGPYGPISNAGAFSLGDLSLQ